jgi:hypothetical protein
MGEGLCLWQTRPRRRHTHRGSVCGSDRMGDFDCGWSGQWVLCSNPDFVRLFVVL